MSGGSRRTACKYCRDRKVRCDGEQPSCEKCRRAGEECIYLPTQRPSRADLTQTIEALQKRLHEAEGRITRMANQATNSSAASATWPSNADFSGPPSFHCPLPPFGSSIANGVPPSTQPGGYPSLNCHALNSVSPGPLNNDFLDSLRSNSSPRATVESGESMRLNGDEDGGNQSSSGNLEFVRFQAQNQTHRSRGCVHVDITALSSPGASTANSASPATLHNSAAAGTAAAASAVAQGAKTNDDISNAIATQLAEFSSAVFHSQAEIAGMSLAVAEYIAWMRKAPAGNAPPNTSLVYINFLEAVEIRLHEIREIAQTRPYAAFREMTAALQALGPAGSSVCNSLGGLEEEFQKRSADVANFFRTRYNACALLSEQAQNVPHAPAQRRDSTTQSINGQQR